MQIYQLARETVVLLLECNPDIGPLLDWVVDRCYTGTTEVADGCFLALATIFSASIVGDAIVVPYLTPDRLDSHIHRLVHDAVLPGLLEYVPLLV
uniref:(California timema) hypothetical protein n=1 Tax=Timema californicum TaxID=61474 RepID=A0A7R9P660_TIMCA|nr:unnamed protein product [Timema californicum]